MNIFSFEAKKEEISPKTRTQALKKGKRLWGKKEDSLKTREHVLAKEHTRLKKST